MCGKGPQTLSAPTHLDTHDGTSALDLREMTRMGFNFYFLGYSLLLYFFKNREELETL